MPLVKLNSDDEALLHEYASFSESTKRFYGTDSANELNLQKCTSRLSTSSFSTMDQLLDDCSIGYSTNSITNSVMTSNEDVTAEESCSEQFESLRLKYQSAIDNNKLLSSKLIQSQQIITSLKEKVDMLARDVSILKSERENLQNSNEKLHKDFQDYKDRETSICWKRMQLRLKNRDEFISCDLSSSLYDQSNKQSLRDFMEESRKLKKTVDESVIYEEILDQCAVASNNTKPQNLAVDKNCEVSKFVLINPETENDIKDNDGSHNGRPESNASTNNINVRHEKKPDVAREIKITKINSDSTNFCNDGTDRSITPIIEESLCPTSSSEELENQTSLSIEVNTRRSSAGFQTLSLDAEISQVQDIQTNASQRRLNSLVSRWAQKAEARAKHRATQKAVAQANHPVIAAAINHDESKNTVGLLKLLPKLSRKNVLDKSLSEVSIDSSETSQSTSAGNTLCTQIDDVNDDISVKSESGKSRKVRVAEPQQHNIIYFR